MAARADFACIACDEVMELPLKAAACPVCGGLLERRFTSAPAVLRGADQGRESVTQRLIETAAANEFDAQVGKVMAKPEEATRTRPIGVNAIPMDARIGSRQYSAPVIAQLMGRQPRAVSDHKPRPG